MHSSEKQTGDDVSTPLVKSRKKRSQRSLPWHITVAKSYPLVRGDPFSQKVKPSGGAGWHCSMCHKERQRGDVPSALRGRGMACVPSEGRETTDNLRHCSPTALAPYPIAGIPLQSARRCSAGWKHHVKPLIRSFFT